MPVEGIIGAMFFYGTLIVQIPIIIVEIVSLWLLEWDSLRRSAIDAVLVNFVTGFAMVWVVPYAILANFLLYSVAIISFGLSILVEGLLFMLRRRDSMFTWSMVLVVNTISHTLVVIPVMLFLYS